MPDARPKPAPAEPAIPEPRCYTSPQLVASTLMVLCQSAATGASQSVDEGRPVQRIDCARLRRGLFGDGQVL